MWVGIVKASGAAKGWGGESLEGFTSVLMVSAVNSELCVLQRRISKAFLDVKCQQRNSTDNLRSGMVPRELLLSPGLRRYGAPKSAFAFHRPQDAALSWNKVQRNWADTLWSELSP